MLNVISQSQTYKYWMSSLGGNTQKSQIHGSRRSNGCPGLKGRGNGELLFNKYRISVREISGNGYWYGCTTIWLFLTALNSTIKNS